MESWICIQLPNPILKNILSSRLDYRNAINEAQFIQPTFGKCTLSLIYYSKSKVTLSVPIFLACNERPDVFLTCLIEFPWQRYFGARIEPLPMDRNQIFALLSKFSSNWTRQRWGVVSVVIKNKTWLCHLWWIMNIFIQKNVDRILVIDAHWALSS